jgi:hypothetical protein
MRPAVVLFTALTLAAGAASAQVAVRYPEGAVHGFLVLTTMDGSHLADGDLMQTVDDDRVTSHIVFHFDDGSLHDETAVFSERGHFRFVSDHLVQKGPAFPRDLDLTIDASGRVVVRHRKQGDAGETVEREQMDLPADLANGLLLTALKNVPPGAGTTHLSLIAATPSPRILSLEITRTGTAPFTTGDLTRRAARLRVKARVGGVTGMLASIAGKQPPDSHVWIVDGDVPAFVRAEEPFYAEGPLWRIELASPRPAQ